MPGKVGATFAACKDYNRAMGMGRIVNDSFFDGFGPGALFSRARRQGAATGVFEAEGTLSGSDSQWTEEAFKLLFGLLTAQLAEGAITPGLPELPLTEDDRRLLELAFEHSSVVRVAAELNVTPPMVRRRLYFIFEELTKRKDILGLPVERSLVHRVAKG